MRLAAQAKGGFYPAHPSAIDLAASFLQAPADEDFTLLDPCAGEGDAVSQLAARLRCPAASTFAIELDDSRTERLCAVLPDARILAPADFFGCQATRNSFSFIWLNPPFDQAYGGYRMEERFLWKSTDWLMPGGVMALVCPEDVVSEYSEVRRHFTTFYENCQIVPFPEDQRPFQEVIIFGQKRHRPQAAPQGVSDRQRWQQCLAPEDFRYLIPPGTGPRVFQKVEPTEPELHRMMSDSPLRKHLTCPSPTSLPSPPLPLGMGHVALLLASGHLNGLVQPVDQPGHVVRGTSRKRSFVSDVSETENDDGGTITRTTISERIDLVIRTVDVTGKIRTFQDAEPEGDDEFIGASRA